MARFGGLGDTPGSLGGLGTGEKMPPGVAGLAGLSEGGPLGGPGGLGGLGGPGGHGGHREHAGPRAGESTTTGQGSATRRIRDWPRHQGLPGP